MFIMYYIIKQRKNSRIWLDFIYDAYMIMLPFKLHITAYCLGKYVIHIMVKMRFGVSKHSQILLLLLVLLLK